MPNENRNSLSSVRYYAKVDGFPPGTLYIRVESWMVPVLAAAALPREVLPTYAALWTARRAGLSFSVARLRMFVPVSGRSIQRQIRALERAGLVMRWERLGERAQLPNEYDLLFHPAMPEALRGPAYVPGVAPLNDVGVRVGNDTGDACPMTSASRDHLDDELGLTQQAATPQVGDVAIELPGPFWEALQHAAPTHAADLRRLFHEAQRALPRERGRPVIVRALRKLIARIEMGEVRNPPGLLRRHLLSDAAQDIDSMLAYRAELLADIVGFDERIAGVRDGFVLRRLMGERAAKVRAYVQLHVEVHGEAPTDVPELAVSDPLLQEAACHVAQLLEAWHGADRRGDDEAARGLKERLEKLEGDVTRLLKSGDGKAQGQDEQSAVDGYPNVDENLRQSEAILEGLRRRAGTRTEPANGIAKEADSREPLPAREDRP